MADNWPYHQALPLGNSFATKGHAHGQPLRKVLNANANGQGHRPSRGRPVKAQCSASKEHPHRQPFRNVVQSDGQHEQRRSVPVRLGAFGLVLAKVDVKVGREFVQSIDEQRTQREANGRRSHLGKSLPSSHVNGWGEQRPKTCRHHHPSREAQHAVKQPAVHGFEWEDQRGTCRGHPPREQRGHQC